MSVTTRRWYEVCLKKLTMYCNLTSQSTPMDDGGPPKKAAFFNPQEATKERSPQSGFNAEEKSNSRYT